jgi:hypothetical protein
VRSSGSAGRVGLDRGRLRQDGGLGDKGIEVKFVERLRVEAELFVRKQTAPLTGLNHVRTVGAILEQARPTDGGR